MVCVRGGTDGDRVFEEERRKRVDWGKEGVEMGVHTFGEARKLMYSGSGGLLYGF